jgi:hypothetical protein
MDNVLEYAQEIVGVREHHVHFHYEVGQKMGHLSGQDANFTHHQGIYKHNSGIDK